MCRSPNDWVLTTMVIKVYFSETDNSKHKGSGRKMCRSPNDRKTAYAMNEINSRQRLWGELQWSEARQITHLYHVTSRTRASDILQSGHLKRFTATSKFYDQELVRKDAPTGVFFQANLYGDTLPYVSPYPNNASDGDVVARVCVPLSIFSDFEAFFQSFVSSNDGCIQATLVLVHPNDDEGKRFCNEHMFPIDWSRNSWLQSDGQCAHQVTYRHGQLFSLWTKVFILDTVPMNQGEKWDFVRHHKQPKTATVIPSKYVEIAPQLSLIPSIPLDKMSQEFQECLHTLVSPEDEQRTRLNTGINTPILHFIFNVVCILLTHVF